MSIDDFASVQPGTKLVVRPDLGARWVYNAQSLAHGMLDFAGSTVTVTVIDKSPNPNRGYDIEIEEDFGRWCWSPGMFSEIISEEKVSLTRFLCQEA